MRKKSGGTKAELKRMRDAAPKPRRKWSVSKMKELTGKKKLAADAEAEAMTAQYNAEIVDIIRHITDTAGHSNVPFLDDAVQLIVNERDRGVRNSRVTDEGCTKYGRCRICIGPLLPNDMTHEHAVCSLCFSKDYNRFIRLYEKRLTQLPEPKPTELFT